MKKQRLSNKNIFLILSIFLIILFILRIGWLSFFKPETIDFEEPGLLDVSDIPFAENEIVSLHGLWGFIPNEFVDWQTIEERKQNDSTEQITVPGDWAEEFTFESEAFPFHMIRKKKKTEIKVKIGILFIKNMNNMPIFLCLTFYLLQ